jgi:hypothetical protein
MEAIKPVHLAAIAQGNVLKPRPLMLRQSPPSMHRNELCALLRELPKQLLAEVEHFFVSYNEIKGKKFNPLGRYGSARALALVRKGCKQAAWLKKPS